MSFLFWIKDELLLLVEAQETWSCFGVCHVEECVNVCARTSECVNTVQYMMFGGAGASLDAFYHCVVPFAKCDQ